MKKIFVSSLMIIMAMFLSYCHTAKKAAAAAPVVSYESNIQPLIMASCAPCHVPSKGGNKEALDNYGNAKKDIDDIIRRIQLNPDEKGFMPMKHPKMSDADIAVFKAWKETGLTEK
jgi:mono/diheme cytochrome c family protein